PVVTLSRMTGRANRGLRADPHRLLAGLDRRRHSGGRPGQVDREGDHGDGEHHHGRVHAEVGVLRKVLDRHTVLPVRSAMALSTASTVVPSLGSSPLARPPTETTERPAVSEELTRTNTRRRRIMSEAINPASAATAPPSARTLPGS